MTKPTEFKVGDRVRLSALGHARFGKTLHCWGNDTPRHKGKRAKCNWGVVTEVLDAHTIMVRRGNNKGSYKQHANFWEVDNNTNAHTPTNQERDGCQHHQGASLPS